MKNIVVAIDGPAGAGKTSIAKILAKECNLTMIDTGAMYRCVALKTIENNITDEEKIIELTKNIKIEFANDKVYLDDIDVTFKIRSKEVNDIVSPISSIVEVRRILVEMQRKLCEGKDVIMEGRDITTVVLPNANYKFYLDAKIEERANAKKDKDFSKADKIRDELLEKGIKLIDTREGTTYELI